MRRRIVIQEQYGLWSLHNDRETSGHVTTGRTLEGCLRKAAVRAGIVEAQDDLRISSTYEAAQVLEEILGKAREESDPTGDQGVAHA